MKAFSMLASAMLAAAIALPAVAADQTKLYDPMAEAEKIVVPVSSSARTVQNRSAML